MTKADLLAGLKGQPVEFTTPSGRKVFLRPLAGSKRLDIERWRIEHEKDPGLNLLMIHQVGAAVLTDADGAITFTPDEIAEMDVLESDAISTEALIRAGMRPREGDPAGKASPPTTAS